MSNRPAVGSRPVANAERGIGVWQSGGRDRSRPYIFAGQLGEGSGNRYRYGGKELTTLKGLNLYDFAARTYAPDLGRFMQPDPSTHDYHWLSPYAYCGGDPVNFIDPTGCDWVSRRVNDVTEYYYDRDVTSQEDADKKYRDGSVTHIGHNLTVSLNGVDYTFKNDLVENKYGKVEANGVEQDNSQIIYGEDYTIFGTTDTSCNAETLHKNLMGTSYTGSGNPQDYKEKDNYQYIPSNRSELGSIAHDKAYENAGANGIWHALFNCRTSIVKADFALVYYNLINLIVAKSFADKCRSAATAMTFGIITLYKFNVNVSYRVCRYTYNYCVDLVVRK